MSSRHRFLRWITVVGLLAGGFLLWRQADVAKKELASVEKAKTDAQTARLTHELAANRANAQEPKPVNTAPSTPTEVGHQRGASTVAPRESEVRVERQKSFSATKSIIGSRTEKMPSGQLYPGLTPIKDITNVGQDSPENTLKTFFWAAANGKIDDLIATMAFSQADQEGLQSSFNRLPESIRKEYGSFERLAAALMMDFPGSHLGFAGIQVLSQQPDDDGGILLEGLHQYTDGRVRAATYRLSRSADGRWLRSYPYGPGLIDHWFQQKPSPK